MTKIVRRGVLPFVCRPQKIVVIVVVCGANVDGKNKKVVEKGRRSKKGICGKK
jgi:hypothetical protein